MAAKSDNPPPYEPPTVEEIDGGGETVSTAPLATG